MTLRQEAFPIYRDLRELLEQAEKLGEVKRVRGARDRDYPPTPLCRLVKRLRKATHLQFIPQRDQACGFARGTADKI